MIKTTILHYYSPYLHKKFFCEYIADNGKSLYTVDGRVVTKEQGNKEFVDTVKKSKTYNVEKFTEDANNDAILKQLDSGIDKYVQYIDDYNQYNTACKNNEKIRTVIKAFKQIAEDA